MPKVRTNLKNEDTNTTITTTTPPSEIEKEKEPAVAILENYLGTKSMDDTVKALQGIRDMLKSGVLTAQSETVDVRPKETVFVIPPMTPEMQLQPIIINPPKVPVASFLSHMAPMPMVQNFILPDLRPLPVQQILPVPIMPSAQFSFKQVKEDGSVTSVSSPNGDGVVVIDSNNAPPSPAFLVNRLQYMNSMPFAPLPIRPSLPSIPSFLVPRPMKPAAVVDVPIQPLVNAPPIFVEPAKVAVGGYPYPYKPCCGRTVLRSPVLLQDRVVVPPRPSYFIDGKVPVMRPPMLVKDIVAVPRPPSIIVNRLEKIAGAKIFGQRPIITMSPFAFPSRESVIEQSKYVNVHPLPAPSTHGNVSGLEDSYKVVNNDGSTTTFSRLSDNVSDEGYYQTDDGRIFYSRLVSDPNPLTSKYFEDEAAKKHRKNQYTVTSEEEYKNLFNRDDVQVTYGTDKDNNPFLSYRVPSDSFQQVNFDKLGPDQSKVEETISKFPKLPSIGSVEPDNTLKFGGIKETLNKSQTAVKGHELPSGPSVYSFKQIHEDGSITRYTAYDLKKSDVLVSQDVQDFKDTKGKSKGVGEISTPEAVMSTEPTNASMYVNHNNDSAVVQVVDLPTRFADIEEVQVKVNNNEHARLDGNKYWNTEIHSVPGSIATMPPSVGLAPTLNKDFIYAPPKDNVRRPSTHKVENETVMGNYSFKMINSDIEPSKSSSNTNTQFSFSSTNPIVIPDEVYENEQEDSSRYRGDIPGAFS